MRSSSRQRSQAGGATCYIDLLHVQVGVDASERLDNQQEQAGQVITTGDASARLDVEVEALRRVSSASDLDHYVRGKAE
jgi:hypothetical protein